MAGPDDESGDSWWTSCAFAEHPSTERSFTVTIATGDVSCGFGGLNGDLQGQAGVPGLLRHLRREPDDRTEPTSAEIRLLKSLLGADVIKG